MRISGGEARGVRLEVPARTRPTSERVRQAVFSSIAPDLDDARVCDLYCGSGAYGLEALSRGAASAVLVDRDARSLRAARHNAEAAGFADRVTFARRDALSFVRAGAREPFDLVFCDPPYADPDALERVLHALGGSLRPGGLFVAESRRSAAEPPDAPPGIVLEADRRYGDTRVLIYRRGDRES